MCSLLAQQRRRAHGTRGGSFPRNRHPLHEMLSFVSYCSPPLQDCTLWRQVHDGVIRVTHIKQHTHKNYELRELMLTRWLETDDEDMTQLDEPRHLFQFHFKVWPDHGVPNDATGVVHFLYDVQACHMVSYLRVTCSFMIHGDNHDVVCYFVALSIFYVFSSVSACTEVRVLPMWPVHFMDVQDVDVFPERWRSLARSLFSWYWTHGYLDRHRYDYQRNRQKRPVTWHRHISCGTDSATSTWRHGADWQSVPIYLQSRTPIRTGKNEFQRRGLFLK